VEPCRGNLENRASYALGAAAATAPHLHARLILIMCGWPRPGAVVGDDRVSVDVRRTADLGGSGDESGGGIAVDNSGNIPLRNVRKAR
jgi:hypothetical protein